MTVGAAVAGDGRSVLAKIFVKTEMKSINNMIHRAFQSSDVPDGVGMLVGDLCWDYGNEDAYICTVAATTVVKLNA